jgi:hypothetical protein
LYATHRLNAEDGYVENVIAYRSESVSVPFEAVTSKKCAPAEPPPGVPEICALLELMARPGGRAPAVTLYVNAPPPPLAGPTWSV